MFAFLPTDLFGTANRAQGRRHQPRALHASGDDSELVRVRKGFVQVLHQCGARQLPQTTWFFSTDPVSVKISAVPKGAELGILLGLLGVSY